MEQALETRQLADVELTAERNPSISQRFQVAQTVPSVQRARHRPRIICEPVSGVKTVSYEDPHLSFRRCRQSSWPRPPAIAASCWRGCSCRSRRARRTPSRTPSTGEAPAAMAARLALAKARSIVAPSALVIGSDQVASLDGQLLRKPGVGRGRRSAASRLPRQNRPVPHGRRGHRHGLRDDVAARRLHRGAVPPARRPRRSSNTCGSRVRSIAPAASSPKGSASRCSNGSRRRTRPRSSACR